MSPLLIALIFQDCDICIERRESDEFPQEGHLSSHAICKSCVNTHLRVQIMDEGSTTIACPHESCKAFLEYQDIEKHADLKVFRRYPPSVPQ